MKQIKYLFIMVAVVMVSVSCSSSDDDSTDEPLVGIWKDEVAEDYVGDILTLTFNENSSGNSYVYNNLGFIEDYDFRWSTDGAKFTLIFNDLEDLTVPYSILGNKLRLHGQDSFLTRQ